MRRLLADTRNALVPLIAALAKATTRAEALEIVEATPTHLLGELAAASVARRYIADELTGVVVQAAGRSAVRTAMGGRAGDAAWQRFKPQRTTAAEQAREAAEALFSKH
ncbi:hypothetical protein [Bradyrhizobium sp. BTAi1]|uniref:hypothetical protein n=1 Tax=Bradyrhizobium sp. (strain BTAi1 / ATCC BAA-1182) TaxID=288000 RepID=UPI00005DF450|nr:hypothetical protein [Bradyrhizobium sp. BTAi1]